VLNGCWTVTVLLDDVVWNLVCADTSGCTWHAAEMMERFQAGPGLVDSVVKLSAAVFMALGKAGSASRSAKGSSGIAAALY
jgi:hypothetical protein